MADNPELEPFTDEEMFNIRWACASFKYFLKVVFPKSFEGEAYLMADGNRHPFELSAIHYEWADRVQYHPRVGVLAPRMHLKSTVLNSGFAMWQALRAWTRGWKFCDGIVFSFNEDLASAHNARTKRFIKSNSYFRFFKDKVPRADSSINFECSLGPGTPQWVFQMDAKGVFGAARGKHPKFALCDDILSDFSSPLDSSQIRRINIIVSNVIMSLPEPQDPLVIVGTPQSYDDALYKLKNNMEFFWFRCPAELEDGTVLWPEKFDKDRLNRKRREVGRSAYQVEYLLIPFTAVNSRIPRALLEACVERGWTGLPLEEPFENPHGHMVFGGMDVGQRVHPSHLSIGMLVGGDLIQIFQRFLHHMDYRAQVKLVNLVIRHFGVDRFYYDSTRAELDDRGLSRRAKGYKFSKKSKGNAALLLEKRVYAEEEEDPGIVLIDDPVQMRQLLAVNQLLIAQETDGMHGDAFWSNSLMCKAAEDGRMLAFGDATGWLSGGKSKAIAGAKV